MVTNPDCNDDHTDDGVDNELISYLDPDHPKSFFLFAGAGSGKTRSVVTALECLCQKSGKRMRLHGQQVAVITYTNAACDEIKNRLKFDPLVDVRTIHSFVWELILGFDCDIRSWLQCNLTSEISELENEQSRGRPGAKIAAERARSIAAKKKRLAALPSITKFTYNPNGDNVGRDSLNHSEVIRIGATFLSTKPLMQALLVSRFPILLIDESQDTNGSLLEALFVVQKSHAERFGLGLFGDTMQRIYSDGMVSLGRNLPPNWERPTKKMNHRCPRRVIQLINKIRSAVDDQTQYARSDAQDGEVRLFVSASGIGDKSETEERARARMAEVTGDDQWKHPEKTKTLILEHHMAARRMGFLEMFRPLYKVDSFKTGLRDGTLPFVRLFSELVLPLVKAKREGNNFALAAIARRASPLLSRKALETAGVDQLAQFKLANKAVDELTGLCLEGTQPRFLEVLQCISRNGLFEIPESMQPFTDLPDEIVAAGDEASGPDEPEESASAALDALKSFLGAPFSQIEVYSKYVKGEAPFSTHQGVKGLEFPRVLVVMDDEDAGGFLFSYEKLFGAKSLTRSDLENVQNGKETGVDRTRRLFYVTCSRSKESLAILAYSAEPAKVREHAIAQGWFDEGEVESLV